MEPKSYPRFFFGLLLLPLMLTVPARAQSGFDTSSPVAFFSSVANKFIQSEPPLTQQGLSITNIPIYPSNCYTPSVHRLLQLAANIYDASTNKTSAPPLQIRLSLRLPADVALAVSSGVTNIIIDGFVEVTTNGDYNFPVYSLPGDLPAVLVALASDNTNFNLYAAPWIIGAKKGLPNFNQISMES